MTTENDWLADARRRVGERIDRRRRAALLSQEEVGEKLDIHQTQVSRWLRGETVPSWTHIRALATLLNSSPTDLLWPLLDGPWAERLRVIEALNADPQLDDTQKHALIAIYSSMTDI